MKKMSMCLAAALGTMIAFSDVIEFKSGSRITGKVVSAEGGVIVFASDDLGEVKVKEASVKQMLTDEKANILFSDKTRQSALVSIKDGKYSVDGKPLAGQTIKALNPKAETWHGSIAISGTASRGNTVSEKATVLVDVSRRYEKDRITANGGYYFAQSGDSRETKQKTENRYVLNGQEDHFWGTRLYQYVNGKYEHDEINNLDFRYRVGTGLGYQWLDKNVFETSGTWSFSQEAGLEYVKEREYDAKPGVDEDYASFRYAHHLNWIPSLVGGVTVFHNFEYHPNVSEWEDQYVFNADAGLKTTIWKEWELLAKVEWDYNSLPAEDAKKSDIRYILGLSYKW